MSLSSNCLFHYTYSLLTLQKIIEVGFSPSFCREFYMAVPMVSFCDIPLTSAIKYMDYGDYAIGMNKGWVERNGLNPVNYINLSSTLESVLFGGLDSAADTVDNIVKIENTNPVSKKTIEAKSMKTLQAIVEVFRYHKTYEGKNDKLDKENYRFYDEREWRYIPTNKNNEFKNHLRLDDYEDYKVKNEKPHLKEICLTMTPDDIDYIIVRSQEDIFPLIDFLESQENLGSSKKIKLLTTRIITKEQIKKDF